MTTQPTMIQKTCDNCEVLLEADDEMAGRRMKCPKCGDVNVMPGTPTAKMAATPADPPPGPPAKLDRAAAAGYPPDSGDEVRVLKVRPAMARAKPLHFLGVLALIVGGIALVIFGVVAPPMMIWAGPLGALLTAASLGILGVWKIITLGGSLEVTNKRTVARRGLLSRASTEVLHNNITNLQITQSFWDRVWNVGTIGISSSGQDDIEIVMSDIPKPHAIKRIIDLYRPLD